uniref:Uncharacterized protein n=1 Tax=Mucochytrium quahogii TaxID=96639 RepID=A0A7S2S6F6_9STRA|mmetsp:Transcript_1295/g.1631  ORF Transcript_1295/g.1631 Transcript_1295/m.1631 type:complete len:521 (+) Transcript_1295:510-2072(+)
MELQKQFGENLVTRSLASSVRTRSPSSQASRSPCSRKGDEQSVFDKPRRFFQIAFIAMISFVILDRLFNAVGNLDKDRTSVVFLGSKGYKWRLVDGTNALESGSDNDIPYYKTQQNKTDDVMELLEEAYLVSKTPIYAALKKTDPRTNKYKLGFKRSTYLKDFIKDAEKTTEEDRTKIIQRDIKLLVEEARELLENITCIPAVCGDPFHLFSASVPKVVLASRPGSGNTWTRNLIRNGMRVYTGSVYSDFSLARGGFKGELLSKYSVKTGVVKSHYPLVSRPGGHYDGQGWSHGTIHVVRAPLDALLAECQRKRSKGPGGHTKALPEKYLKRTCTNFAISRSRSYNAAVRYWEKDTDSYGETFKDFTGNLRFKFVNGKPTFSLFYEDLSRDLQSALLHLFAALKYFYRNQMPSVYEATACALHSLKVTEKFHRKATTPKLFENRPDIVEPLCRKFRTYWNVHKWGECDGTLQKHRTDVTKIQPISIPSDFCDSTIEEKDTVRLDPLFEANTTRKSGDESP